MGSFDGTSSGPWVTPGLGTSQTAGAYLGSLPDVPDVPDVLDSNTLGSFGVVGQPQPNPPQVPNPLGHYNSLPVTTDHTLYDPEYVISGSSEGLIGYLLDENGTITKFFVLLFTFQLFQYY